MPTQKIKVKNSKTPDRRSQAMHMVSIRMPEDLVLDLKRIAKTKDCKYQALARSALTDFVTNATKRDATLTF